MPISHNHKCIFIHIPKTGGITIEHTLGIKQIIENYINPTSELELKYKKMTTPITHIPASLFKQLRPDIYDSYLKFSVVRNPYDRMLSEYFWLHRDKDFFKSFTQEQIVEHFNKWIINYYGSINTWRKCPQYMFLYDDSGNLLVDHVLKFEQYDSEVKRLLAMLNITVNKLDKKNQSSSSSYKSLLLTAEIKEKIYTLFAKDFEIFGYEK